MSDTFGGYRMVGLPANWVEGKEKYQGAEGPPYSELSSSHILQRTGQQKVFIELQLIMGRT